jgi:hypothetical protein
MYANKDKVACAGDISNGLIPDRPQVAPAFLRPQWAELAGGTIWRRQIAVISKLTRIVAKERAQSQVDAAPLR